MLVCLLNGDLPHVQNSEEDVASSLLGTPYMATQASHPRAPVTTPRRRAPTLARQDHPQVDSLHSNAKATSELMQC